MKEPKNPVTVIKDGKEYPAEYCYKLEAPYFFQTPKFSVMLSNEDNPIYFKRKQIKNSFGSKGLKQTLLDIKYCIGKINKDNVKKEYWINSKGDII